MGGVFIIVLTVSFGIYFPLIKPTAELEIGRMVNTRV